MSDKRNTAEFTARVQVMAVGPYYGGSYVAAPVTNEEGLLVGYEVLLSTQPYTTEFFSATDIVKQ